MSEPQPPPEENGKSPSLQDFLAIGLGIVAAVYLLNPTLGVFELIPDNIPILGNLDEALASAIVLGVLRYFGIDPTKALVGERGGPEAKDEAPNPFEDPPTPPRSDDEAS